MINKASPFKWLKKATGHWSGLVLALCLVLSTASAIPIEARDGLSVVSSSVQAEFPLQLSFNLSAQSDVEITDIRLHYVVDQASFAQVTSEVYIEFTPSSTVDARWTWDMRKTGGLPPGSSVDYWWTVEDAKGKAVETPSARIQFDDARYSWRSLTDGKVTLYWYEGEQAFARELMTSAQQALARLTEDTGAYLEKPVKIYIYADSSDLQGAMVYPQEWTGGVAFIRYDIIAIGIAPNDLDWGKRAIAHELAHLVTNQVTFNPYSGLPTWLDEGLAMYAEGALQPQFSSYLNEAIDKNSLISVRSLSSPFSAYGGEAYLSYAESYSLVEFLITNYGQGKMLDLLHTFRQGSSYDTALKEAYGFDADGLDKLWRSYVTAPVQSAEETTMLSASIRAAAALATRLLLGSGLAIKNSV
jgi:hypothetical protein